MSRQTKNFITSYKHYTRHSEAPDMYHIWTSLFMMSAAVRRKVWFKNGYWKIFPNLYIVFISPPGKGKKSSAAGIGVDILKELGDIQFSSESVTREALIKDLKNSRAQYTDSEGNKMEHCSLSIFSSELSVFLGHKNSGNESMIALLTDLYDCPTKWTYRTKMSGTDILDNVFLAKMACTTFDYLASSLPMDAIGGGLTSREIFVVEFMKRHKAPLLDEMITDEDSAIRELLKIDLESISMCQGEFKLSDEVRTMYKEWYELQDDANPVIKDERFFGYLERKPIHLLKVAMLMSLAEGDSLTVEVPHWLNALELFKKTEKNMPHAFGARGRSASAVDLERILFQIIAHWKLDPSGYIMRKTIAKQNYRNVDANTLRAIFQMLEDMGEVTQTYVDGDFQIRYIGEFTKD